MERPNPNDYIFNGYEKALDRYHNYLELKVEVLKYLLKRISMTEEEIIEQMNKTKE